MNLGQVEALLKRHHEKHRRAMLCAGVVASAVLNSAGRVRKDGVPSVDPMDFVPEWESKPKPRQTLEEQIVIMTLGFGCGPGKVN